MICLLIAAGLVVAMFWVIYEPRRRASRVHDAIQPGINFRDVEPLLTGRYYCFFQTKTNGQWHTMLQPFADPDAIQLTGKPGTMRLLIHFLGWSPYRVSFYVELDGNGNVTKVTEPYGWD